MKIGILREKVIQDCSLNEKLSLLSDNTGNILFWNSINRLFNPDIISFGSLEKVKEYEKIILTNLIWIRENVEFDYLEKIILDNPNTAFIPMSVGLQCSEFKEDFSFGKSVIRILDNIQKKAVIGVRGEYTAKQLRKNGITNIQIIGCPSMYYWNNPNLKILSTINEPKNLTCNFKSSPFEFQKFNEIDSSFLKYCCDRNALFVEQIKIADNVKNLETEGDKKIYHWLKEHLGIFYNFEEWIYALRNYDFSLGSRFHGNVIALQAGMKSLFLVVDSRTKEMIDFFNLPSITPSEFDSKKDLSYYYKLADYSKFNENYPKLFKNFLIFLKKNGLSIVHTAKPLEFGELDFSVKNNELIYDENLSNNFEWDYLMSNGCSFDKNSKLLKTGKSDPCWAILCKKIPTPDNKKIELTIDCCTETTSHLKVDIGNKDDSIKRCIFSTSFSTNNTRSKISFSINLPDDLFSLKNLILKIYLNNSNESATLYSVNLKSI